MGSPSEEVKRLDLSSEAVERRKAQQAQRSPKVKGCSILAVLIVVIGAVVMLAIIGATVGDDGTSARTTTSSIIRDDIADRRDDLVSQPTPVRTDTPTIQVRSASARPLPCPTPAETRFLEAYAKEQRVMSDMHTRQGQLFSRVAATPSLFDTDEFKATFVLQSAALLAAAKNAIDLKPPTASPRAQNLHMQIARMALRVIASTTTLARAFDTMDQRAFDEGARLLEEATRDLQGIARDIDRLCA